MIEEKCIILSVMVISHNQVHLIGRCLDSILAQKIRVPWEIVISDDNSTDGTWEWIQEFAKQTHEPRVVISQINSSDYNPTVTSDRCAANKANVYSHASGKYCVNIDADDYLLGDDIYQYQIDQLEAHLECTMALQNIWYQNDGEPIEKGHPWHYDGFLKENEILTMQDYCQRRMFTSNPAFMMRRDPDLNPMEKYGLLFDDAIISIHHITKGKIICSARAQYVYVQYQNSIWNQVSNSGDSLVRKLSGLINYLKFFKEISCDMITMSMPLWVACLKEKLRTTSSTEISMSAKKYITRSNNNFLKLFTTNEVCNKYIIKFVLYECLFINKFKIKNQFLLTVFQKSIK